MVSPTIPVRAGIALKAEHYHDVLEDRPPVGWFEVHTENYMGAGGPPHRWLKAVRARWPVSLHGVGLSLGSPQPPNAFHLARTRTLIERYEPGLVSEHLSWSFAGGVYLNDLLPLPYTEESLETVCENVLRTQEALGRAILIENPSTYAAFTHSVIPEPEFLGAVAARTGCGILLDVNNVYVSACNRGFDAVDYLRAVPAALVGEIHLAGHTVRRVRGARVHIDDHGSPVCEAVWDLYALVIGLCGRVPTLIEWDTALPPLSELVAQARHADDLAEREIRHAVPA